MKNFFDSLIICIPLVKTKLLIYHNMNLDHNFGRYDNNCIFSKIAAGVTHFSIFWKKNPIVWPLFSFVIARVIWISYQNDIFLKYQKFEKFQR